MHWLRQKRLVSQSLRIACVVVSFLAMALVVPGGHPANGQDNVPDRYQGLYTQLATVLDATRTYVDAHQPAELVPMTFATELLTANGNRGTALLDPSTLPATVLYLDRLQQLGVQGVTIAVKYPLYTPNDPHFDDYRAFYRQVAATVRDHGIKMDVEATALFAGTVFTNETVSFSGLTLDRYEAEEHQMVQDVIDDMAPDYVTIVAEPSTEAALTGVSELDTPDGITAFVGAVLDGLDRGATLVGAGAGAWESPDFDLSLASGTSIDYITVHIYPLDGTDIRNALADADYAHQYGKRVVLDETWLYKATPRELGSGGIAATAQIFQRDGYSFFAPLDQEYLYDVAGLARMMGVEYLSPFWSGYFFAYLDYDPAYDTLPYRQFVAALNRQQAANLVAGTFTSTGLYYQQLICAATAAC